MRELPPLLPIQRNAVVHDIMTMNRWANQIHEWAHRKGWWNREGDTVPAKLLLIHSEVSEAAEAYREQFKVIDLSSVTLEERDKNGRMKPVGFASELADTIIRILDLCAHLEIDIDEAVRLKMTYNETREVRHGGKAI